GCSVTEIPADRVRSGSSTRCRRKCHGRIYDWTRRQESETGRGRRWHRDRYRLGTNGVLGGRGRISRSLGYREGLSARINMRDGSPCPCGSVSKVPTETVRERSTCSAGRKGDGRVDCGA